MNIDLRIIFGIFKKDLRGMLPLVLLTAALFLIDSILASQDPRDITALLGLLRQYTPWLCMLSCAILIVAVIQLDPAVSLNHDWLARPISAMNLLLAKCLFIGAAILAPLIIARFLVNLSNGYSLLESLLEASFIKNSWIFLVIPIFASAAVLSRTLIHCFGILIGILLVLLALTINTSATVFNPDAFGSETTLTSLVWLIGYVLAVLLFASFLSVYWLQYRYRKHKQAWIAFSFFMFMSAMVIVAVTSAPSWNSAFAIQQSVVRNPDTSLQESLNLDRVTACFPASLIEPEKTYELTIGSEQWSESQFARAGAGALSFITTYKTRGIPDDWRVFPLKVTASYTGETLNTPYKFLPSGNASASPVTPHDNSASNYWLLPADVTRQLVNDPTTQLRLDYSLGLLSPYSIELELDGERRHIPKFGYCSAELNSILNQVDVECFKRGVQPVLMSAELVNVPASRVDSGRPDYSPKWTQLFSGKHYELTVLSPTLVDSSKIILTAYEMEGFFEKQLNSPGLVGASTATCPLSVEFQSAQSNWSDKSPHETSFVAVDRAVRLEVLDWGGTGTTLVLLPGGGATAHSYDDLAQRLTDRYRVIGITRRGFGNSSKPDYGYDIARLSQDVIEVLDALNIDSSILVGHSLAGHELSYLGAENPERFSGLIYLDAGYDNSEINKPDAPLIQLLPPTPGATPSELMSYAALQTYFLRIGRELALPEGEVMASIDFATGTGISDPRIVDALIAGLERPEYERIHLPVLSIYAIDQASPADYIKPWYDEDDPLIQSTVEELFKIRSSYQLKQIEEFRKKIKQSEVIVIEDSKHWIFLADEDIVISAIHEFMEKNNL